MDILTHLLAGLAIGKVLIKTEVKFKYIFIVFGSLIPDIGEIVIQNSLNLKYGETFGVYDTRTSDIEIASNKSVTFLYDILHSLVLPSFLILCSIFIRKYQQDISNAIKLLSFGLLSHILLDSFTHGTVWALKLFYPITNVRFPIFQYSVGNWWDWQPQFKLLYFKLPILCIFIWTLLTIIIWKVKRKSH